MKVAKYVAQFLEQANIEHIFTVTGGGAMHLNDAFGHSEHLTCIYNHHEQASAIAAEAYTRHTGKLAVVCVTTGPGGTNAITGVLGGWLDSIPMLIISGQVKRETTIYASEVPLRQLGDQEFNIIDSVRPMTKYCAMVKEPEEIRYHLEKALYLSCNGRGGPAWIDIPLDIQGAQIEPEKLIGFVEEDYKQGFIPSYGKSLSEVILHKIQEAKRPVVFAGAGIRLSGGYDAFLKLIDKLQIPVVTAWNSHDLIWDTHPLYCGRPGTLGDRGGNFVVQNSDLLLILGSRLNIRQISYNYKLFAPEAFKILIDIDENELRKPTIAPDMPIHADVKEVMESLLRTEYHSDNFSHIKWLKVAKELNRKYPVVLPEYYEKNISLNPYVFIKELFKEFIEGEDIICGNGSACVISFQAGIMKKGQRMFTNSGCAAMGYGFPAAIGVCVANNNKRTICIDGDGSFQMNIQELQTVVYNRLNIKIIYLNNNGYHSIRQTQTNLFQPPLVGVCDGNGLSFPDAEKIAYAYGIPYIKIDKSEDIRDKAEKLLSMEGPVFCEAIVDPKQSFAPKLSSKVLPDGRMVSPELDDLFPFLGREEYEGVKKSLHKQY